MVFSKRIATVHILTTLAALLAATACTQSDDASTNAGSAETIGRGPGGTPDEDTPTPQAVGSAAPGEITEAANNAVEIASGYVTELKDSATYNNPTGGTIRVHVTRCALTSLALSVRNSEGIPLSPRYAGGTANADRSVDMYYTIPPQNLGYVTLWAWANSDARSCYMVVTQTEGGAHPPPASCSGLEEFECLHTGGCSPRYEFLATNSTVTRVYRDCRMLFRGASPDGESDGHNDN